MPHVVPRNREDKMRLYYSIINIFIPCFWVKPIALRQPYSHTLSFTFYVVETSSKKKAKVSAMTPMTPTKILKSIINAFTPLPIVKLEKEQLLHR